MHTHFKHHHLRRYLLAFGTLFDAITVSREDSDGNEHDRLVVPLQYGPKERWLTRLAQDPEFKQGVGQIVPRMSYEITSVVYDSSRKLNTINKLTYDSDVAHSRAKVYVGVPYTLTLSLAALTKYQQDGMQIVEQILPYFTPNYTIALRPLEDYPDLVEQVPITLQSVSHNDNYEEDFIKRRVIIWTLDFSMKVFFYGPTRDSKRIEEVDVNLYNSLDTDLSAVPDSALPWVNIEVVPDPADQDLNGNTALITSNTTITENFTSNG